MADRQIDNFCKTITPRHFSFQITTNKIKKSTTKEIMDKFYILSQLFFVKFPTDYCRLQLDYSVEQQRNYNSSDHQIAPLWVILNHLNADHAFLYNSTVLLKLSIRWHT